MEKETIIDAGQQKSAIKQAGMCTRMSTFML